MAKRKTNPDVHKVTQHLHRILRKASKQQYVLRLYVTGITVKSSQAIANIRAVCEEHLTGRYDLQVIDIYQQPKEAVGGQIIAAPTLVKQCPPPQRRMIGDLRDRNRVLLGLDLQENPATSRVKRTKAIKWVEL